MGVSEPIPGRQLRDWVALQVAAAGGTDAVTSRGKQEVFEAWLSGERAGGVLAMEEAKVVIEAVNPSLGSRTVTKRLKGLEEAGLVERGANFQNVVVTGPEEAGELGSAQTLDRRGFEFFLAGAVGWWRSGRSEKSLKEAARPWVQELEERGLVEVHGLQREWVDVEAGFDESLVAWLSILEQLEAGREVDAVVQEAMGGRMQWFDAFRELVASRLV